MDILNMSDEILCMELIKVFKAKRVLGQKYKKFKNSHLANYMNYDELESILGTSIVNAINAFKNYKLRLKGEKMNPEYPLIKDQTRFDNFGMLYGYCEKAFHYNVDKMYKKVVEHEVLEYY